MTSRERDEASFPLERLEKLERAVFGDPSDPKSLAILPTLARANSWMDAGCVVWRAFWAALLASPGFYAIGRTQGWW